MIIGEYSPRRSRGYTYFETIIDDFRIEIQPLSFSSYEQSLYIAGKDVLGLLKETDCVKFSIVNFFYMYLHNNMMTY